MCHIYSLINFWAGLYKTDFQEQIGDGVKVLLEVASRILSTQQRAAPTTLRLMQAEDEEEQKNSGG